jgi:hypothetical protein
MHFNGLRDKPLSLRDFHVCSGQHSPTFGSKFGAKHAFAGECGVDVANDGC